MAHLSPAEQDVLRLARSVIRDMAHSYSERDLACPPAETCRRLSALLGDEYNFEDSTCKEAEEKKQTVVTYENFLRIEDVQSRIGDLVDAGYHIHPITYCSAFGFLVQAVNPALMASQQTANVQSLMQRLQQSGVPAWGSGGGGGMPGGGMAGGR